ncbi:hypothetical protein [Plebeiibacterium sediminum]|uniref:Uncharacterized protein n=1 Tax=Plebeiibacterium sediminum TaxID=2992112 RepID=A0AAE3M7Q2_9BACT|nr:hypothetical protein [Plebeiobacterium sediminum]MCW3788349.1 hypothetical protein [Plebeiobacterium sediminum]
MEVEKELIIELLNKSNQKGLYTLIISCYEDLIKKKLESGVGILLIKKIIEKDLNIKEDTINYNSFLKAIQRKFKAKKESKNTLKDKKDIENIDSINLNIYQDNNSKKNPFD